MKTIFLLLTLSPQIVFAQSLFDATEQLESRSLPSTERSAMIVQVNDNLLLNQTNQFDIQLPNGILTTVVFDRLQKHASDRFSWFGHLKGQPQEQVFFSAVKGHYAGSLFTKTGVFEFTPVQKNHMRIAELITENFPECDGEKGINDAIENSEIDSIDYQNQNAANIQNNSGVIDFDVMVLYTPEAKQGAGGTAAIEATAQAAVDGMNLSFINSQVNAQANLSYTGMIQYNDSGDLSDDLTWLRNNASVAQLRTAYGADMVSLLVNGGGCGIGYVMRSPGPGFAGSAFQITGRGCAVGNLTLAHEFGHNMGLEHNPENSSTDSDGASFPWSFGHYHDGSYRTVMSYSSPCDSSCGRRQYFSNPDVLFNDLETGIDGERDNARTLGQTTSIIAAFRLPANDTLFEDDFE